jgi:methylmalonyl-CoA mutase cobalamin-binding subunit
MEPPPKRATRGLLPPVWRGGANATVPSTQSFAATAQRTSLARQRRSLIVLVGDDRVADSSARALAQSLHDAGIATEYLGRESSARRVSAAAVVGRADAIEVCLPGAGGVRFLRELLSELNAAGRRQVSIVVHRIC